MKKAVVAASVAALLFSSVLGGVVPGRWEKVKALQRGALIIVSTNAGDRTEGEFIALNSEALQIRSRGTDRDLPRASIIQITTLREVEDSSKNGTLIGLLAGVAMGAAIGFASGEDGVFDGLSSAGNAVVLGIIGAGAGTVSGYAIDKATKKREILYLSP